MNEIYLQKGLFRQKDGFIAFIGKPGQGKSPLCSAYIKYFMVQIKKYLVYPIQH